MPQPVAVALYHRDHQSLGRSRQILGSSGYHWGIMVMPDQGDGRGCHSFDATDASDIDPVTFRMTNPKMDWWFRHVEDVDLTLPTKLIGRIVIGQAPDDASSASLRQFFERIPLPVKNKEPQQSCVTWTLNAVRALQAHNWAEEFDVGKFKDWAVAYADERMKGPDSKEADVVKYQPV